MDYNKPSVAALIGALSTIPFELITRLLVVLGIAKYTVYELNSLMITVNRPNVILGAIAAMLLSAGIALVFYYSLKFLGWDYLIIKSISVSLLSWLVLEVLFMWLIEGRGLIPPRPINDYFSEMTGAVVFGVTLGLLFRTYLLKANMR